MTLFASVLSLSRSDIQALRIRDPYSVHRVVYGLFEDVRSTEQKESHFQSGILYVDKGGDATSRNILMLSDRQPARHATTSDGRPAGAVLSKAISENFLEHARYQFKVVVNPTQRNNQSKKLIPIRSYAEIEQWFVERSSKDWGFKSTDLIVDDVQVLQFPNKAQQLVTLSHAHIHGLLAVTDRIAFQKSFAQGLGRNSAFGCGLLQLVPIIHNPFDFN